MKTLKNDVISVSKKIGSNTAKVAEAVQTDIAYKFAEILEKSKNKNSEIKKDFDSMERDTVELFNTALAGFNRVSKDINKQAGILIGQSKKQALKLTKIDRDDSLKKSLFKITRDQLLANQKIAYKNGRKIGFKEYTEMATRTRIQHDLLEQEKKDGESIKQLFYICDTYSDCANDHLEYQGKIYYDEKVWKSISRKNPNYDQLKAAVKKCKASVEYITGKPVYLCTRPNCRHRLIPIAISDVVDLSLNKILKNNNAYKGSYTKSAIKKNYADSQKQRAIELKIRTAKRNAEIYQKFYKKTKDPDYLTAANRAKYSIRSGQTRMRKLIASNSALKRDYRRENPYHLQKDLGVGYNTEPVRVKVEPPAIKFNGEEKYLEEIKKTKLTEAQKKSLEDYSGFDYAEINKVFYDKKTLMEEIEGDKEYLKKITKDIENLKSIFKNNHIKNDKAIVTYRGSENFIKDDDTTIIFTGFSSSSFDPEVADRFIGGVIYQKKVPARYKIIIPPDAQNRTIYINSKEKEILIDTNSVYDIIGEENVKIDGNVVKQYTLLMRGNYDKN